MLTHGIALGVITRQQMKVLDGRGTIATYLAQSDTNAGISSRGSGLRRAPAEGTGEQHGWSQLSLGVTSGYSERYPACTPQKPGLSTATGHPVSMHGVVMLYKQCHLS